MTTQLSTGLALVLPLMLSAPAAAQNPSWQVQYAEGFETPGSTWGMDEEIVDKNKADPTKPEYDPSYVLRYASGTGNVERSGDTAASGSFSLLVWANGKRLLNDKHSNHVIAHKRLDSLQLDPDKVTGVWRYELFFYVPDVTNDPEFAGQTGPDFSIQLTRKDKSSGVLKTYTAGIRYIANRADLDNYGKWQIWTGDNGQAAGVAAWHGEPTLLRINTLRLQDREVLPGNWYCAALEVDYTEGSEHYVRFEAHGPNLNPSWTFDLRDVKIAPEAHKWSEKALWISVEAENQWTDGQLDRHYKVYYDRVRLLEALAKGTVPTDGRARERLTRWIESLQYSTDPRHGTMSNDPKSHGAIRVHHDIGSYLGGAAYYQVNPYFANQAVTGLLRARRPFALQVAERWIDWYLRHTGANNAVPPGVPPPPAGEIYNHWYRKDGTGETTRVDAEGEYADATDSYAATFLGMVQAYAEVGASADRFRQKSAARFINERSDGIREVANVILGLQQADGLTWNKREPTRQFDIQSILGGVPASVELTADHGYATGSKIPVVIGNTTLLKQVPATATITGARTFTVPVSPDKLPSSSTTVLFNPSTRVEYTMDNSEVYRGLRAMEKLERDVFLHATPADAALAAGPYKTGAERVLRGMMGRLPGDPPEVQPDPRIHLYHPTDKLFRVSKQDGPNGPVFGDADLSRWFADTTAQLWPHLFGVIEPRSTLAAHLLATVNATWDGDPNLDWTLHLVGTFPFTSVGYAAQIAGDVGRARAHADLVLEQRFPVFPYPWTVADAGWLLRTLHDRVPEHVLPGTSLFDVGLDVDVAGDTAVLSGAGRAFVAMRDATTKEWSIVRKLVPSIDPATIIFGEPVAISGDTIVVGSRGDDSHHPNDGFCNSGAVYVYEKPSGGWTQNNSVSLKETYKLTAGDAACGNHFGISLDLDGNTLVVGATNLQSAGTNAGRAYVFERSSTTGRFEEKARLTAAPETGFWPGFRVAVSGGRVAVVGWRKKAAPASVRVYDRATGWAGATSSAELTGRDAGARDGFGRSIAMDGDTVVVGAHERDCGPGSAYVFVRSGTGWTQRAKLTASDGQAGDALGYSVGVSGGTIVAGARGDDDGLLCPDPTCDSGAVYVFRRPASGWADAVEDLKIVASDAIGDELLGQSVAIDGSIVLAGAPAADHAANNFGSDYVFELPFAVTPTGPTVLVAPVDTTTGAQTVTLELNSVTGAGETTVTTTFIQPDPSGAFAPQESLPFGFKPGEPPTVWQIETTATVSGAIKVGIDYGGIRFDNVNALRLLHFEGSSWVDRTTSRDPAKNEISATVTSLSPFVIVEPADPATLFRNLIADVEALDFHHGTRKKLVHWLEHALRDLQRSRRDHAVKRVGQFLKTVTKKRGKKIPPAAADALIAAARAILRILGS